jgi:hypothetical protein
LINSLPATAPNEFLSEISAEVLLSEKSWEIAPVAVAALYDDEA